MCTFDFKMSLSLRSLILCTDLLRKRNVPLDIIHCILSFENPTESLDRCTKCKMFGSIKCDLVCDCCTTLTKCCNRCWDNDEITDLGSYCRSNRCHSRWRCVACYDPKIRISTLDAKYRYISCTCGKTRLVRITMKI